MSYCLHPLLLLPEDLCSHQLFHQSRFRWLHCRFSSIGFCLWSQLFLQVRHHHSPNCWTQNKLLPGIHSFFWCVVAEHIQHRSFLSGRSGWRYLHCFPFRQPSVVPQKRHCLALSIDAASFDTTPDLPALSWETAFWRAFVAGFSPSAGSGTLWTRASISACRSSWNWSRDSVDFLSSMRVSMRNAETRKRAWGCCWRIFETTWSKAFTCSIKSGRNAPSSRARALCRFQSRSPFVALTGSFAWVNSDKRLDQHQVDKSSESCESPLTAGVLGWPPSPDEVRLAAQATTSPWCVVPDFGLPKSHY